MKVANIGLRIIVSRSQNVSLLLSAVHNTWHFTETYNKRAASCHGDEYSGCARREAEGKPHEAVDAKIFPVINIVWVSRMRRPTTVHSFQGRLKFSVLGELPDSAPEAGTCSRHDISVSHLYAGPCKTEQGALPFGCTGAAIGCQLIQYFMDRTGRVLLTSEIFAPEITVLFVFKVLEMSSHLVTHNLVHLFKTRWVCTYVIQEHHGRPPHSVMRPWRQLLTVPLPRSTGSQIREMIEVKELEEINMAVCPIASDPSDSTGPESCWKMQQREHRLYKWKLPK